MVKGKVMLKIKDNVDITLVENYGFEKAESFVQRNWEYVLRDGTIKIWIDKYRLLHFNSPRLEQIDKVYKMHNLLEITDTYSNLKMLSRNQLQNENKALKERIKELERQVKNND